MFQALLPYAVEELCNVAESLIVPVRMGIARPTAPFTLASTSIDAVQGSEELFSVEPLPPRPSPDQSSRSVSFSFYPHFLFDSSWQLRWFIKMCVYYDVFQVIESICWFILGEKGGKGKEDAWFFLFTTYNDSGLVLHFSSSSQTAASYIIRNPQPRRSSQSQPVRGRDEEQDDIVSADVEEVGSLIIKSLRP